jgi:hypothetical protein
MSLYNNIFGFGNSAALLLQILKLDIDNVPRFRDCYYDTEKELICIHTRTGGGNRDFYENEEDCRNNYPEYFSGDSSEYPCGPWNEDLRNHKLFKYDEDSSYDSTYANFYFKIPEELIEEFKKFPAGSTPEEKWELLFKNLNK